MQESGEMYLETIFVLSKKNMPVRSLDVANYLGFSKPSVSRAMGILKNGNYIEVDDKGYLTLTAEGLKIAKKIYERHVLQLFTVFADIRLVSCIDVIMEARMLQQKTCTAVRY